MKRSEWADPRGRWWAACLSRGTRWAAEDGMGLQFGDGQRVYTWGGVKVPEAGSPTCKIGPPSHKGRKRSSAWHGKMIFWIIFLPLLLFSDHKTIQSLGREKNTMSYHPCSNPKGQTVTEGSNNGERHTQK